MCDTINNTMDHIVNYARGNLDKVKESAQLFYCCCLFGTGSSLVTKAIHAMIDDQCDEVSSIGSQQSVWGIGFLFFFLPFFFFFFYFTASMLLCLCACL